MQETTNKRLVLIPEIKLSLTFDKKLKKSELFSITSSKDVAEALRQVFNQDTFDWTEEFIILCMNRKNCVIGFFKVSQGGITSTVVDQRVIFTAALNCPGTCALILAHNHPSGNCQPSESDNLLTKKLKDGGKILDIALLDHVILTDESYYSYADEGLM